MNRDAWDRRLLTEREVIDILYKNPSFNLSKLELNDPSIHNAAVSDNFSDLNKIRKLEAIEVDPITWHKLNQQDWSMPAEYKNLDIAAWVLEQCKGNEVELQRCGQELLEFASRDLLPLLQYIKYLVDLMKEHDIVWGVGRGSSVASFVLYKIGIHRINSIEYQLPLEEFFKELINDKGITNG